MSETFDFERLFCDNCPTAPSDVRQIAQGVESEEDIVREVTAYGCDMIEQTNCPGREINWKQNHKKYTGPNFTCGNPAASPARRIVKAALEWDDLSH
ncbi:MAG: hypothetical protein U5L95_00200 [Candidatus Saccharibacteria bacterium]|nr:hypothetical protein [Candidatus Saccharibacteria bacterium]